MLENLNEITVKAFCSVLNQTASAALQSTLQLNILFWFISDLCHHVNRKDVENDEQLVSL